MSKVSAHNRVLTLLFPAIRIEGWLMRKMCKTLVVSLGKMCYTIFDPTEEWLVM
jgi:hypothetical protein